MPREYDGAKFYSNADLSIGHNLEKAEPVIELFSEDETYNVNQVIEFFNIQELMEVGGFPRSWSEEKYEQLKQKSKRFSRAICTFFTQIDNENIATILEKVDIMYVDDFWHLLCKYKR